jgi:L-ascorbate metabolism protein UlaG (beta-lactamase superfamily)
MRLGLYERIFPRFRPRSSWRPRGRGDRPLVVRWLGTAGFVVQTEKTTVLVDPFVSRQSLGAVALLPMKPDDDAIAKYIPARVDAVLCGHSHYDHVLDAPRIAKKTGAKLVGSRSTCAWGRAEGVAEDKLVEIPPDGAALTIGDVKVRFVASVHGKVKFGPLRIPQLPGEVPTVKPGAHRVFDYKMGGAYGLLLEAADVTLYHNGSADLVDAELEGVHADVLIAGLAGRRATRDYTKRLVTLLRPKLAIPTHHDAFFAPLERGAHLLPNIDVEGFESEVRSASEKTRMLAPDYLEDLVIPSSDPHDAFIWD